VYGAFFSLSPFGANTVPHRMYKLNSKRYTIAKSVIMFIKQMAYMVLEKAGVESGKFAVTMSC